MDELKFLKGKLLERINNLDAEKQPYNAFETNVRIDEDNKIVAWLDGMINTLEKRNTKKGDK